MLIIAGLALCGAVIGILTNRHRSRLNYKYDLRPNCLLTANPLVFVSGRRSLFYFGRYWNFLPEFLRDHGYEVKDLTLPWRNRQGRQAALQEFLTHYPGQSFHWIGDATCAAELDYLCRHFPSAVAGAWVITARAAGPHPDAAPRASTLHLPLARRSKKIKFWHHPLPRLLVFCHQVLFSGPSLRMEPLVLGHPAYCDLSQCGKLYLDFAISLAENEV